MTRGFPFDEVTRTYALHGCGNAPFRVGAPASQAFCLDGAARLGYTDNAGSSRVYHITVDFTGARIAGFNGIFTDANYSGVDLGVQYRRPGEAAVTEGAYVYTYPDLTGSYTFGVPQVGPPTLTRTPFSSTVTRMHFSPTTRLTSHAMIASGTGRTSCSSLSR